MTGSTKVATNDLNRINGLDASEDAKRDERSEDEDSTGGGRGLGSAREEGKWNASIECI